MLSRWNGCSKVMANPIAFRYFFCCIRFINFCSLKTTQNVSFMDQYAANLQCIRSGGGHTAEQRVAASTLRRYSFGLRLAIAQADARPAMPFRYDST